ncbi:MAG: protein-L-isoaspartate(D-aspartate) O-methyltransferase [Bacillota bacterium]
MNEEGYAVLREDMVQTQLIPRGITDGRVLEAFRHVPRHFFVEAGQGHLAYRDHPLAIGEEQTISQPYIVALMTQSLGLQGEEKVLEIGTGSGYQTAILAELAGHVYTVERLPSLSAKAQQVLASLHYSNISFKTGDGSKGWPEHGPFDGILVAAAAGILPPALPAQLSRGGRLVIPVGRGWQQDLYLYINEEGGLLRHNLCGCRFVPLIEEK